MDADRVAQRALELHETASMPLSEALALALREAEPEPIWPIARLFIDSGGNVCGDSYLYAPGLPEGEHDVYPLPVNADAAPVAGVPAPDPDRCIGGAAGEAIYGVKTVDGGQQE